MPPLEAWFALIGGTLVVIVVPWLRVRRLRSRLREPLPGVPAELLVSWLDEAPDPKRARKGSSTSEDVPGSLSTIEVLFQLSRFDRTQLAGYCPPRLPRTFEQLVASISVAIDDPKDAEFAFSRLGEQLLAEQLRKQGFDVQLTPPAEARRNGLPGWVALVDGQRVRLIAGRDATEAKAYVERHPENPVVTLGDYEEEFSEYAQVWAVEQVTRAQFVPDAGSEAEVFTQTSQSSGDGMTEQAGSRASGLAELGALVAGRAVNPLLLSALRGAQLAKKGDKHWISHATGGLMDQAGASVGGWAGARAGALAGALFGPLGVAAGGFVGGLLGKKVGQGITEGQKQKKLRKLLSKQEDFLAEVPELLCRALEQQATHLHAIEVGFAPKGFFAVVFPSPAMLMRGELAAQYRAWKNRSARRALTLRKWLKQNPKPAARAARARKLLTKGRLAWSSELLELRSELVLLQFQIAEERARLEGAS